MTCSMHSKHSCCSSNHSSHTQASNVQYYSTTVTVAKYVKILRKHCSITTTVTTSIELFCKYSSTTTVATSVEVLCKYCSTTTVAKPAEVLCKSCNTPTTVVTSAEVLCKYCSTTHYRHLLKYCASTAVQQITLIC